MASATALLRSSADTPLSRPSERKLRALTTSVINGLTSGSSSRHIAATATACLKLFSGAFPFSFGSSGRFFGTLAHSNRMSPLFWKKHGSYLPQITGGLAMSCKYSKPLAACNAIFILLNQSNGACFGVRSKEKKAKHEDLHEEFFVSLQSITVELLHCDNLIDNGGNKPIRLPLSSSTFLSALQQNHRTLTDSSIRYRVIVAVADGSVSESDFPMMRSGKGECIVKMKEMKMSARRKAEVWDFMVAM
nr:hypothetical protein Iba_chr12dCG15950 [Ipomoea batatas]